MRVCASHPLRSPVDLARDGRELRPSDLPGSSRPGPHAAWRSLDAEIGGPVRRRGHSGRSLRRHQHHPPRRRRRHRRPPAGRARRPRRPKRRPRPRPRGPVDLFGTTYAPEERHASGGTVIIGDWQEATQFNPYYLGQVTEANVASLVWHSLLTITHDFKYIPQLAAEPIPTTDNGGVKAPGDNGDAMTVTWKLRDGLKWSDGEPLTCDDFKYAWEWVMDKDNIGRRHRRLRGHHRASSAPPTPT